MSLDIVNSCNKLPPLTIWYIRKCLQWIPQLDINGIEKIQLVDKISDSDINLTNEVHKLYIGNGLISGAYSKESINTSAFILLSIQDLYFPIPYVAYFSPMPIIYIARVISHEVAHHLVNTRGFIFSPDEKYPVFKEKPALEEEMANRYAFEVVARMRKHWYYKFGTYMMDSLSEWYYGLAAAKWEAKIYEDSTNYWYKSWLLNSERQETIEWYWRSKKKLEESSKSQITTV